MPRITNMERAEGISDSSKIAELTNVEMSTNNDAASRSMSPVEVSLSLFEDSFDYPDDEATRAKMLSAALQQEDEFLEYLMSLPAVAATETTATVKEVASKHPPLLRSTSEKGSAKVGLDHLDNLCKLMEQLGDLRERNSKLQRRVQYLEDLKHLQEMHKQLQQETRHRHRNEDELIQNLHRHRECSFPTESPRRSKKHSRHRQSLQPSPQQRDRSQSVGIDEIINEYHQEDFTRTSTKQGKRQRRSIAGFTSGNKSKVSKWTKVKEAFRWEKASVATLPETKSQDSGIGGITSHHRGADGGRYLRVPVGEALSGSPSADSVISSHSMCSSGGPSTGEYALPPTTVISSTSSSSEELEFDLNYSDILMEFGPQRSASATDSIGGQISVPLTRRLSLTRTLEEEDASRRSKSLDGDENNVNMLIARQFANKDDAKSCTHKSHKTPWGKVKDIIQTRKDSLKQRHHSRQSQGDNTKTRQRRGSQKMDAREEKTSSDVEEEAPVFDPVETPAARDVSGSTSPTVEDHVEGVKPTYVKPRIEITAEPNRRHKTSTTSLGNYPDTVALTNRRLTPMLTITLPSTEELRQLNTPRAVNKCTNKPPPSPQTEERVMKMTQTQTPSTSPPSGDDVPTRKHDIKQQMSVSGPLGVADGTSPPVNRRSSKWTKVKKAFLTSSVAGQRNDEACGQLSGSMPSSPNRISSFFYETDPDEFSSNELGEGACEDDEHLQDSNSEPTSLQAEIQRNYEELQQKLSQEFHKKLHEWERMKSVTSATSPGACRASTSATGGSDENYLHDKGFRRKMEEWERMKHKEGTNNGKRDSVAIHQLDEDNLSPHFLKKLHEWQRIKKASQRDENPQSRKKLGEWQLWRTGSGKQGGEENDDFHRKLQEWERMKSISPCESPTSKDAGGVDSDRNSSGGKTPSPGVVRKNSTSGNTKKKPVSGGSGTAKPVPKAKTQKEKELHWLEKELQKIEREKQRLEREREKYLDKESRLEKMRRAVGSSPSKQEVLIQTSTGFFRFQGISEKFTRRLYEWEKARGIAPEASTFALLDPGYRPSGERQGGGVDNLENGTLTRSKSASSVTNLTSGISSGATITHQLSSLSLNDVEGLEQASRGGAHHITEADLNDDDDAEYDEPAAVIVDVEDVVEETAALLEETPAVLGETPVYCYAPEEVTRLIDSSGSESERDTSGMVRRTDSVRTESSYQLIEENINLLSKLQIKGDICRKLETDLDDLEEKIDQVKRTHEKELERLRQEEKEIQELTAARAAMQLDHSGATDEDSASLVDNLRARIRELERRQERLRREGATLQDSFAVHSEQQAALAQNLVGKMKLLQQVNSNMASFEQDTQSVSGCLTGTQEDAVAVVQELSTQLLGLAEKLEVALGERNREIHSLRFELEDRRRGGGSGAGVRMSRGLSADSSMSVSLGSLIAPETNSKPFQYSTQYLPRQSSVELTQLPSLLTNKVLELKQGLNFLCATTEPHPDVAEREETASLRVSTKRYPREACLKAVEESSVTTHVEGNITPVTSVTITPGFLRRQTRVKETSQDRENLIELERKTKTPELPSQEETIVNFRTTRSPSISSANECADDARNLDSITIVAKDTTSIDESCTIGEDVGIPLAQKIIVVGKNYKVCEDADSIERPAKDRTKSGDENRGGKKKMVKPRRSAESLAALKVKTKAKEEDVALVIRALCHSDSISVEDRSATNTSVSMIPKRVVNVTEVLDHTVPENTIDTQTPATPANVFVPTTRKIFSPVRRDSKGKASSVIGYVVQEEGEIEPTTVTNGIAVCESNIPRPVAVTTTPPWMISRSRSQSASPALPRKKLMGDNTSDESGYMRRGFQLSPDSVAEGGHKVSLVRRSSDTCKETKDRFKSPIVTDESKAAALQIGSTGLNEQLKELSMDKKESLLPVNPTTCVPLGFPPLPPSPGPGRRDLFKQIAKDTAPSIRMMIAKYNQKLTEQEGGRSPEVGGSGSGSPVAWRSPVSERRVRSQMAKYQEEVQRVLQQGSRRIGRGGFGEVQKSASAGVIRSPETSSLHNKSSCNGAQGMSSTPPVIERRGILKSSSAGSIKQVHTSPLAIPTTYTPKEISLPLKTLPVIEDVLIPNTISTDNTERILIPPTETVQPASPRLVRAPELSTDIMGSPPLTRLRALRLQRAKEEFLTHGPGSHSWTSDRDTSMLESLDSSVSSEQVWVKNEASCSGQTSKNRLSQISVGSESSYDSQILPLSQEGMENDDEGSLIKSASAGMINVDSKTYKKFSLESGTDSLPRTSKEKTNSGNKFGISSLTSKFRKVKMRKIKEKDVNSGGSAGGKSKLNTVSLLCRQSLLVDINKKEGCIGVDAPSTSKSCPSSPVLQRTTSTENTAEEIADSHGSTSWLRNPAKKIFKPK